MTSLARRSSLRAEVIGDDDQQGAQREAEMRPRPRHLGVARRASVLKRKIAHTAYRLARPAGIFQRRAQRARRERSLTRRRPVVDDAPPMTAPAAAHTRIRAFFASAFSWNMGLGMTHILIPLYADHLGYSGVAIGSLVALPVLVQVAFNLLGGAWTDRVGGKRLALASCLAFLAAGIVFVFAASFAALLVAQLCVIVSRAMFWPATWSLGSQLPGDRGAQMGRLNSITNAGQIVGTIAAGLALAHFGFATGFWLVAGFGGALSFALLSAFVAPAPGRPVAPQPIFAAYRALARRPSIWFALMCAYVSALPFSLSFSFYPLLLVSQGFASDEAGWMLAVRALGSVFAGATAARYVRRVAARAIPFAAALGVALAVLLVAAFDRAVPIAALLFLVGFASGVMTLYFQLLISELSSAETRGSALALGGLGWGLSHLTTPLIMGGLKDTLGIEAGFYAMGAIALAWAAALPPTQAWAFRGGRPR
jgi:MFS family permease